MNLIYFLLIGLLAGFIANSLMKGGGAGLLANLIVGVVGALLGGFVFGLLGLASTGLLGSLVTAVVGACLLLWLIGVMKKR